MKRVQNFGFKTPLYWMLAITLCFTACKKGDTGPSGDKGDQGEKGTKGDKGDKGDKGSANVFYSQWLDVTFTQIPGSGFFAELTEPKLTDSILSFGEVRVYVNGNTPSDKLVHPLPFVSSTLTIRPVFMQGIIELSSNLNVSTGVDNGEKFQQYRYIIIPGGAALRSGIDWSNYEDVKAKLGLKD